MNDEQRAALVDILKTFYGEARYTGTSIITEDARHTRRAIAAIRDLLATRAVPTVDADAVERAENAAWAKLMRHSDMGRVPWASNLAKAAMEYGIEAALHAAAPGLDELLDSVGGEITQTAPWPSGGYLAIIEVMTGTHGLDDDQYTEYHGTGPTRMDAIRNAALQATGITPGDAREGGEGAT